MVILGFLLFVVCFSLLFISSSLFSIRARCRCSFPGLLWLSSLVSPVPHYSAPRVTSCFALQAFFMLQRFLIFVSVPAGFQDFSHSGFLWRRRHGSSTSSCLSEPVRQQHKFFGFNNSEQTRFRTTTGSQRSERWQTHRPAVAALTHH